jgi:hypothetical protein
LTRLIGLTAQFTGFGFIHGECTAHELLALEAGNSGFGCNAIGYLDFLEIALSTGR